MRINAQKSGLENVFALINEANGTNYSEDTVSLSELMPYRANYHTANTSARLTGIDPRYVKNEAIIYYSRFDLKDTVNVKPAYYMVDGATTTLSIKQKILSVMNLVPSEVFFTDYMTEKNTEISHVTIRANADSCLYTGEIKLTFIWSDVTYEEILIFEDLVYDGHGNQIPRAYVRINQFMREQLSQPDYW